MTDLFIDKMAIMSVCEKYRYTLRRTWDETKPYVNFIGLNPSTADAYTDDPTIRRCISFAKAWGYGGIVVTNLFALRATNPKLMLNHDSPMGFQNDKHIINYAAEAGIVLAAWGTHGSHISRDKTVLKILREWTSITEVYCLGITKDGHPKHPLYIKGDTKPVSYKG